MLILRLKLCQELNYLSVVVTEDRIRTISVAKMNFLRPTEETFLTTGYYDELTGKNAKNGLGVNQMQEEIINPNDGSKPYSKMSITDPGEKATDNGLLGITSINVKTNTSFVPQRLNDR
jgi:hypothetical protein